MENKPIPQNRSLEVQPTLKDHVQELKNKGFIESASFSSLPEFNPTEEEIKMMPENIQEWVKGLVKYRNMAIMRDTITDKLNTKRIIIKKAIERYNPKLAESYKEDNKLQSSSVMQTLVLIWVIDMDYPLSSELTQRVEQLRKIINGTDDEGDFTPKAYIENLDNDEKEKVARELDTLVLDVFHYLLKKTKKE